MATASLEPRVRSGVRLRVRKRTGTLGDTLIAWGLAFVASEVSTRDVVLGDGPDAFDITVRATPDQLGSLCAQYHPTRRVMVPWLGSSEKGRHAPTDLDYAVDRDLLRDDYAQLRQHGQRPDAGGDAPAVSADPLAPKYPLFQVLTNPGTQWKGFNAFVERARVFWTPAGVEVLFRAFSADLVDHELDALLDDGMQRLGLAKSGDRRRNPPGFLFPGESKGPTMRLDRGGTVIGQAALLDWMQADRGDLSMAELYLAYVGFFAVGVILSFKGGRVVAVPVPDRVSVPRVLGFVDRVRLRAFPTSSAATAADAALGYGAAALNYLAELVPAEARLGPNILVFAGVQLAVFWMPSGNTYAIEHVTFAPLPRWITPLFLKRGYDAAIEALAIHQRRVQTIGRAEGGEARAAVIAYRETLSGDALAWLRVIPAWHRAVQAEQWVPSWSAAEVEEIVMALQADLIDIIHDPAFASITDAIRRSTVQAHYARVNRQAESSGAVMSDRPGSLLSPQYDLVGSLQEAAARHPDEFLRELCQFVAEYNDEAMRRKQRLVRKEDLEQLIAWIVNDRRGIVPALVLAFGVSPRRRPPAAASDEVGAGADEDEHEPGEDE